MKNRRMVLDLCMIAMIATLYSKNALSLAYHEIAGLALGLLIVLHLFFNRKWVAGVMRNRGNLSGRVRALAWVDLLLGISWFAVIVTGIGVSKKLFSFDLGGIWIRLHFFSGAIALLLTGIHLAMHRNFFAGFFRTKAALAILVLFTLTGCWGMTRLNLRTWVMAPFIPRDGFRAREDVEAGVPDRQGRMGGEQERGRGRHDEPFSAVKLFEVIFGVISTLLVVNAGEYAVEKAIANYKARRRLS